MSPLLPGLLARLADLVRIPDGASPSCQLCRQARPVPGTVPGTDPRLCLACLANPDPNDADRDRSSW